MAADDLDRYIIKRGRRYTYRRRVPVDLVPMLGEHAKTALKTDSFDLARRRAAQVNETVEAYWADLRTSGSSAALVERFQRALALAQRLGWPYRPLDELAQAPAADVVERLAALRDVGDRRTITAVLGGAPAPSFRLSTLQAEYDRLTPETRRGKSEAQIRLASNPKRKAITNLIALIGDKPLEEVTRDDALALRAWWAKRLEAERLTVNSANKDFGHIAVMWRTVSDGRRLGLDEPFKGLRFRDNGNGAHKTRGETVSTAWIRRVLLAPAPLATLNAEARWLVQVMAETGARESELCGLEDGDIVLQHAVPHIRIRPNATRQLKTPESQRDLPLVGAAMPAVQALIKAGGLKRYRNKAVSFSNAVNKFLRENGLFEAPRQSLYSLRHAFQDRLIAVDCPDRVAADLMGHKFHRPRYGAGASLEHKREWLLRIAVAATVPNRR